MILALLMLVAIAGTKMSAQVTVGSDLSPERAALLDLKSQVPDTDNATTDEGGLLLPRVKLVDRSTLEPFIGTTDPDWINDATSQVKKKHTGLVVYNITNDATADLASGFYYWNGVLWIRMVTELPTSQLNLRNLQSSTASIQGGPDGSGGATLNFGTITIPEDGSYAFNFRMYGPIESITSDPQRCIYYLSVWVDGVLKDIAEINIYAYMPTHYRYTYSVALGCSASAGQTVTFKLSNYYAPDSWTLISSNSNTAANRTSMIWWKL